MSEGAIRNSTFGKVHKLVFEVVQVPCKAPEAVFKVSESWAQKRCCWIILLAGSVARSLVQPWAEFQKSPFKQYHALAVGEVSSEYITIIKEEFVRFLWSIRVVSCIRHGCNMENGCIDNMAA